MTPYKQTTDSAKKVISSLVCTMVSRINGQSSKYRGIEDVISKGVTISLIRHR
jgi:hypothetical protein